MLQTDHYWIFASGRFHGFQISDNLIYNKHSKAI